MRHWKKQSMNMMNLTSQLLGAGGFYWARNSRRNESIFTGNGKPELLKKRLFGLA